MRIDGVDVGFFNTRKRIDEARKHKKGWGYELWIENIPEYCGKLLFFSAGKKCSMHFHINKLETMYLQSGYVCISLIDPENGSKYEIVMHAGDSLRIPRGQMHQIIAYENSWLFEFSMTHSDEDSYRIEKGD